MSELPDKMFDSVVKWVRSWPFYIGAGQLAELSEIVEKTDNYAELDRLVDEWEERNFSPELVAMLRFDRERVVPMATTFAIRSAAGEGD